MLDQLLSASASEFRRARRVRGFQFQFFILPILIWLAIFGISYSQRGGNRHNGEVVYVDNQDNPVANLDLGTQLVSELERLAGEVESPIFGVRIEMVQIDPQLPAANNFGFPGPLVRIPHNLSLFHSEHGTGEIPTVEVLSPAFAEELSRDLLSELSWLVISEPFSDLELVRSISLETEVLAPSETEENTSFRYVITLFSTYTPVFIPIFYISYTFTTERDLHTIETMLSLPIPPNAIVFSKIIAGIALSVISSGIFTTCLVLFSWTTNSPWGGDIGLPPFSISLGTLIGYFTLVLITLIVAIVLMMAVIIPIRDRQVADQISTVAVLLPVGIVVLLVDILGLAGRLSLLHLLPWTHAYSAFNKLLYPKTYQHQLISGSMAGDLGLHFGSMLVFSVLATWTAVKRFSPDKEIYWK